MLHGSKMLDYNLIKKIENYRELGYRIALYSPTQGRIYLCAKILNVKDIDLNIFYTVEEALELLENEENNKKLRNFLEM